MTPDGGAFVLLVMLVGFLAMVVAAGVLERWFVR